MYSVKSHIVINVILPYVFSDQKRDQSMYKGGAETIPRKILRNVSPFTFPAFGMKRHMGESIFQM